MEDRVVRNNKWWYNRIRGNNWFFFRYWWFNWLVFITCIFLFWWFCPCAQPVNNISCDNSNLNQQLNDISSIIDSCCDCQVQIIEDTIPKQARTNCRVHFTGALISDFQVQGHISEIYVNDIYSNYVGSGHYPKNTSAFPQAVEHSFDGIAVDKGTRLIIYSEENYQGNILLDVTGPMVINNVMFKGDNRLGDFINKKFKGALEINYPKSSRIWSESNMRKWSYGSCKIMCNQ